MKSLLLFRIEERIMGSYRQRDTKLGTCTPNQVYQVLRTSPQGLSTQEVKKETSNLWS